MHVLSERGMTSECQPDGENDREEFQQRVVGFFVGPIAHCGVTAFDHPFPVVGLFFPRNLLFLIDGNNARLAPHSHRYLQLDHCWISIVMLRPCRTDLAVSTRAYWPYVARNARAIDRAADFHGAPYGKVECHLLQCVSQPIAADAPHCYTMGIFEIGKLPSLGCAYIARWLDGLPFHPGDRT
jgi:hypothetical protein